MCGSFPLSVEPHSLANPTPSISSNFNRPDPSRRSLWVGNVPQSASLLDLKDHFSRHATEDIESVLLINESNCAFVNYRSVAACVASLSSCHGSEFQGSRLVCKLQKRHSEVTTNQTRTSGSCSRVVAGVNNKSASRSADRYFVMKSFTKEELKASWQNGIWATQAHNEFKLKQAFEVSQSMLSLLRIIVFACCLPLTIATRRSLLSKFTWSFRQTNLASILVMLGCCQQLTIMTYR